MKIRVKLFAVACQLAESDTVDIDLPKGATVGDLRREIARQHAPLAPLVPHLMIALDTDYADDDRIVCPDQEIACIPPVSGG